MFIEAMSTVFNAVIVTYVRQIGSDPEARVLFSTAEVSMLFFRLVSNGPMRIQCYGVGCLAS